MVKNKEHPTKIIFLWHMHQPYYKVPHKNAYTLPWVRLHAIKDYWGMAKTVEKFEKVKVSFNFSGALIEQLLDYIHCGAEDHYLTLTLKNPAYLTKSERDFIIDRFFSTNFDRRIKTHSRYAQLYQKKISPKPTFTREDIGDLQALFNLSWLHPYSIQNDKNLAKLVLKEKNYTQTDREYIIRSQYKIMKEILPLYKKLTQRGQVELTLTPHYHPIMPLLFDSDIVKDFSYMKKPARRFSAVQDCSWHLNQSRKVFGQAFDYVPKGSWPSEGSVSEDVAALYGREGFSWIGADEAILFKSLISDTVSYDMIKNQRHLIYRPYAYDGINIFFRDRNFSDMISFTYQGWDDSKFAADDLVEHFKRTHNHIKNIFKERAITIIMDGENAWEYFPNNGVTFLESVYAKLQHHECLTTATPQEFLSGTQPKRLERLASGSWINGDFGVWVGSKTNNQYWHILRQIHDLIKVSDLKEAKLAKVQEYFHVIEGSDWFWWNTFEDKTNSFKQIFFTYVQEIYRLLNKPLPALVSTTLAQLGK